MKELIIAEKKNAAKRIAQILSGGEFEADKIKNVPVYQFEKNGKDTTKVIGLRGHIRKVDFSEEYSNWQSSNPKELIRADIKKKTINANTVSVLKSIATNSNKIIIATDFDREGELIGKDAADVSGFPDKEIYRVRFSALTDEEINKAFSNKGRIDYKLSSSGEARQIIDLIWGASLTRYISLNARRYGNNFLSVGRVQTPTLAIIVKKEKEIERFEPKPYWKVLGKFVIDDNEFKAGHENGRFWKEDEADSSIESTESKGEVKDLKKRKKTEKPPIPFNTTQFLRAAGAINISPSKAMNIAETLYTAGYISYPRTDNTVYPESLNLENKLKMLSDSKEFKSNAKSILKSNFEPTRGDKSTKDHPPIHPTSLAPKKNLSDDEWKVYELIVRRFLATLSKKAVREIIKIKIKSGDEIFKTTGSKYLRLGWRYHYPYYRRREKKLPSMSEGNALKVKDIIKEDKETQPPNRYSSNRLISKMEKLGLGTKATRHGTLSKLYSRNYIHGNPPKPTNAAKSVVETLEKFAEQITKPNMTSLLEKEMDKIKEGKTEMEDVVEDSKKMLEGIFKNLEENKKEISDYLKEGLRKEKVIGKCPKCGENLIIRRSKKGSRFVGCSGFPECNFSLPLPKSGSLIKTKNMCKEHNINKLKVTYNKNKSPWFLGCPKCNYDEWKSKK